jgi:uncharacterized protein (TIGR03083 family)
VNAAGRSLPAGLRTRVLDASLRARSPGQTIPEAPAISAAEAFSRAADALYQTLRALSDDDWRRPAIRGLDVQGLVGHLTGVEEDVQRGLAGDPEVGQVGHVESTQAAADRQAGRRPARTLSEWHRTVGRTLALLAGSDGLDACVALHGIQLPLGGLLVARAFELWTHENDIRLATGLPLAVPDTSTLQLMTRLATGLLPHAVLRTGLLSQTAQVHLVLTGPGGGTWDVGLGDGARSDPAQVSIVTDAVGFCRLVANRVRPAELELHITGDRGQAEGILAAAATLALD